MDISSWGLGRIMQLPDHCFGRRFMVSCALHTTGGAQAWDISEIAFPEMCVIWELSIFTGYQAYGTDWFRLAFGDRLPAAAAEMDALEPLFNGLGVQGIGPRQIEIPLNVNVFVVRLRMPVATAGRRLILELTPSAAATQGITVMLVVSAIPKEVPDWLVSAIV